MNHTSYPMLTLPQMLMQQARTQPHRVALQQKDFGIWQSVTWADYCRRSAHAGLGLRALGLSSHGHVGIIAENRLEWVLAQMGAGMVGGIAVGVYPTSPASEVAYVLNHADVEIVVCEDQEQTDKVVEALDQLPHLRAIVVMETKGMRTVDERVRERVISFAQLEERGRAYQAQHPDLINQVLAGQTLNDIGLIIYTSGSTGKPKGAMISYANMRGVAPGIIDRLGLSPSTRHLSYLPLCHVAEQMLTTFCPVYLGSTVAFGESIRTVQEDLREIAPTMFLGVPRIWEKLHSAISIKMQEAGALPRWLFQHAMSACAPFAHKAASQRSLRERLTYGLWYLLILRALQNFIGLRRVNVALTGAAPIPPAIIQFFRTLGVPLVEVYGLTESTGMITGQAIDHVLPGSVGTPILGVQHRLGEHDELLIKGDMVFAGYYKNPQATAQTVRDGWLHTGDVAQERDGQLFIVDRLKDIMITAGGKNLTPSEIEKTMKASPYIKECIVIADGRKFVSALIQIDYETVAKWAETRQIPFTHFRSLVEHEQVQELIDTQVAQGNAQLAQVSRIRKFHLLTKELDHDDGEVTATMKVRRSSIYKTYEQVIESLYSEQAHV